MRARNPGNAGGVIGDPGGDRHDLVHPWIDPADRPESQPARDGGLFRHGGGDVGAQAHDDPGVGAGQPPGQDRRAPGPVLGRQ